MILKNSVEWDSSLMDSMPLEDYKKINYPARVVVRKQGGGFYEIGSFETVESLEEVLKDGLIRGPEQCDRLCIYREKGS